MATNPKQTESPTAGEIAALETLFEQIVRERNAAQAALAVLVLDHRIQVFLQANDPKALEQARAALPTEAA
jgi:hypothetical protein